MTDDAAVERLVAQRAKQGLPPKVTDSATLAKIATIIESAPRLSAEQLEQLRRLLPRPDGGDVH
jgi:aconitase B